MDGEIGVDSEPEKGSTFWFEITWPYKNEIQAIPASTDTHVVLFNHNPFQQQVFARYCQYLGIDFDAFNETNALLQCLTEIETKPIHLFLNEASCKGECDEISQHIREKCSGRVKIYLLAHITSVSETSRNEKTFDKLIMLPVKYQDIENCLIAERKQSKPEQTATENKLTIKALKILVAEDSDINAKVITVYLSKAGHQVTRVSNGLEAVTALQTSQFDLVLMDMRMPEMDGLQATRAWRAQEADNQHIPITALTANATTEDKQQCISAGMDHFFKQTCEPKPTF